MSKVYEKSVIVTCKHLDDLQHVNNLVYMDWVQEIAEEHWMSVIGKKNTEFQYWIVFEHNIKYLKQVFIEDQLVIKTFLEPTEGVKIPRKVEFYRGDDLVVEARTIWVVMDRKRDRPLRPDKEIMSRFGL